MNAKKDPKIFLEHILENIEKIENGINGMTEIEFSQDVDTQDATLRRLEVMGEAVRNIPASFRKKHAKVPWKKIAGMRDILIHEYFGVDMELVWKIANADVLKLKKQIAKLLEKF